MYSIGEFSKIVSLPIKTIRYYHEQGLLIPVHVDNDSGYRYFDDANVDTARVIKTLREFGFAVREIEKILNEHDEDSDILTFLRRRRDRIVHELQSLSKTQKSIDTVIRIAERNQAVANESYFEIIEKEIDSVLIAGKRMQGKYSECGVAFKSLGRAVGRYINGKAMMLCYDTEHKEDDADFEPCMPIRQPKKTIESISVRELPGGRFATLVHKGPYDSLGTSYQKLLSYLNEKKYVAQIPSREVYIKGPGMIFKGNPQNYVTELQFRIDAEE